MTTFEQGPALWKVGYLRFASRPVSISSSLSSSSLPCIYKRKPSWKTSEAPLLKGTYIQSQTSMWGNQRISRLEHILKEKEANLTFKFRTGISSSSSSSSSSDSPDKNVQNCMYFSENLVHHLNYDWSVVKIVMILTVDVFENTYRNHPWRWLGSWPAAPALELLFSPSLHLNSYHKVTE